MHSPPDCVGTTEANLQDALDAADANGAGRDEIRVGLGLFNDGPAVNVAGSPVDIIGVASNQTAIRTSSNTAGVVILDIEEPTSTISNLRVHHNSTPANATGIVLKGHASDILVTNQGVTSQFDGIRMDGSTAVIEDTSVDLIWPPNLQNRAVFVTGSNAQIRDSSLDATVGVFASGGTVTVRRSRIRATQGVVAGSGATGSVFDTVIRSPGAFASNFVEAALAAGGTGSSTLNVTRVTAFSDANADVGVWVQANTGPGNDAVAHLTSTVIFGFQLAIQDFQGGTGDTAGSDSSYSAYDESAVSESGGASHTPSNDLDLASTGPGFLNPPDDLRLALTSPLVDRGDPADTPPSPFICLLVGCGDVDGLNRRVDGDANGSAIVDIGAHEYQRAAPTATAIATPSTVATGEAATFDASASTDPDGETLTYSWTFDDGATSTDAVVQHAFAGAGDHTGSVTVTDPTGQTANATATVSVTPPGTPPDGSGSQPPPPPPGAAVADLTAPLITNARADPKVFAVGPRATAIAARAKRGTRFRFTLSERATMTIAIYRTRPGRRAGRRCVAPSPQLRRAKRCTRFRKAGTLTRRDLAAGAGNVPFSGRLGRKALRPGTYEARFTATDAAGNKSITRRVKFRIVRR